MSEELNLSIEKNLHFQYVPSKKNLKHSGEKENNNEEATIFRGDYFSLILLVRNTEWVLQSQSLPPTPTCCDCPCLSLTAGQDHETSTATGGGDAQ